MLAGHLGCLVGACEDPRGELGSWGAFLGSGVTQSSLAGSESQGVTGTRAVSGWRRGLCAEEYGCVFVHLGVSGPQERSARRADDGAEGDPRVRSLDIQVSRSLLLRRPEGPVHVQCLSRQ